MTALPAGHNEVPSCHGGLENLDEEHDYWIEEIDGELPSDLVGTFLRNGPGRQRIGGRAYGHWFDGDGMLCAFTFDNGRAHFRNRYVRTPKYVDETREQRILYRGFGTRIPGGLRANFLKMPANPANTSLIHHGGMLLALNEGGRPWRLDPATLETIGEYDYDGMLGPGNVFSAHGKIHNRTGQYINFGAGISGFGLRGPKPCLNVYRVDASGRMADKAQLPLDRFPFCHDFALTDRHAVFFINSIVFGGMGSVMLGRKTISEGVRFDADQPMQILVVDLDSLAVTHRFEADPGAIIHFGNAFEEAGRIVIDGMFADNFDANETLKDVFNPAGRFGGGAYNRYTLDLATGALHAERVSEHESEFPTFDARVAGRRQQYTYTACSIDNGANSFFNAIQKIDFDGNSTLVTLPPGQYGSEPMFAPRVGGTAEDDGYVLDVVYDAWQHRSEVHVYRAQNPAERQATLKLPHHIPHQFHGQFSTQVFRKADQGSQGSI